MSAVDDDEEKDINILPEGSYYIFVQHSGKALHVYSYTTISI